MMEIMTLDDPIVFKFGDKFRGEMPRVSEHAVQRAKDRFNVPDKNAKIWVQNKLVFAKYINTNKDYRDNYSYIFRNKEVLIAVSTDLSTITTIMDASEWMIPNESVSDTIHDLSKEVNKIALIKFKKIKKNYRATMRRNKLRIAELNVALAELNLKVMRAKNESIINAYRAHIIAIKDRITELEKEMNEVEVQNRQITYGLSLYMQAGDKINGMV